MLFDISFVRLKRKAKLVNAKNEIGHLPKDRIIVALDVSTLEEVDKLVTLLAPHVGCFKVGLELISSVGGPQVVKYIQDRGGRVFYDGKFNDIPNTVGKASAAVSKQGVAMFNLHASSGIEAMIAAVEAAKKNGSPEVMAVTVLTSLDDEVNAPLTFNAPSKAEVVQFARNAKLAGIKVIICSPQELSVLGKQKELADIKKAAPGIRSSGDPIDDQKRTLTPTQAICAGANWLVIGRPITNAKSPVEAAQRIADEIEVGLPERHHLALFDSGNIKFGAFKLKLHQTNPSAPLSPVYLDIRNLPDWVYDLQGEILANLARHQGITDFDYVIGIPKAGEPIGKAFARAVGKPHLRIEKVETDGNRKITSNILDPFERGKKVVLIDDLVTKAHTKMEAIESVEANGLEVVATLVIYDREQGGLAELNKNGRKVCAAAKLSEMLEFFVREKKISSAKKDEVMAYVAAN